MNILKSIWAVLAGFLMGGILSTATDIVLEKAGIFTPPGEGVFVTWMLVVALAYRMLYTVGGGYVTASLAPSRPMRHVLILGCIGIAAATVDTILGWNLFEHWYPIALVITALPCTWLGGKLGIKPSSDS